MPTVLDELLRNYFRPLSYVYLLALPLPTIRACHPLEKQSTPTSIHTEPANSRVACLWAWQVIRHRKALNSPEGQPLQLCLSKRLPPGCKQSQHDF